MTKTTTIKLNEILSHPSYFRGGATGEELRSLAGEVASAVAAKESRPDLDARELPARPSFLRYLFGEK